MNSKNPKQSRKDFNSRQIIGRVGKPEEISDLIDSVTLDEINFVSKDVFKADNFILSIVGSVTKSDALIEKMNLLNQK